MSTEINHGNFLPDFHSTPLWDFDTDSNSGKRIFAEKRSKNLVIKELFMETNHPETYDGRQDHIPSLKTPEIESFTNVYEGKDYTIDFTVPEFTAVCPKTGLPDFGVIFISYIPTGRCIELKSFKEYILSYRNVGIFHEFLVNKIMEDLIAAIDPKYLKVIGDYNPRGGIKTVVTREYSKT
ncbi:preQ(1) synthase [Leptospira alexanderi]|uniref:preQ(1) synthase n=1 Tax=Leptospira alexanderi TaxID=100053 RepID=UPI000287B670|nr:preQ(1) synthase [Leptospira alexanderi]